MAEMWVNTEHGEIGLEEWGGLMARFPQYGQRAIASALKSEGFRIQKRIKTLIQAGGREVSPPWQELNPHTRILNRMRGRGGNAQTVQNFRRSRRGISKGQAARRIYKRHWIGPTKGPLARFAGATRYSYHDEGEGGQVLVGFIKHSMVGEARRQAQGFRTKVTPRMRKMAFAMGFPLREETTELVTPPRPIIGPVFREERDRILKNVREKALRNIYRYCTGKAADVVEREWTI